MFPEFLQGGPLLIGTLIRIIVVMENNLGYMYIFLSNKKDPQPCFFRLCFTCLSKEIRTIRVKSTTRKQSHYRATFRQNSNNNCVNVQFSWREIQPVPKFVTSNDKPYTGSTTVWRNRFTFNV